MKNTRQFLVVLASVGAIALWILANIALWNWLTPNPIMGAGVVFTGYVLPGLALAIFSDLRRRP